ncbi:MAG TPA: CoA pyrophosphatase [Dehalococcoidia bacterium]|nr:CoA pyrophosphatase [Dehalococcoidia bacterium]
MIEVIKARLAAYAPRRLPEGERPRAAVLLPLYPKDGSLHVVFTKRSEDVRTHKGEVSFPGGAVDEKDPDLIATALREAMEEIGLYPDHVVVIGELDEIVTISEFHVSVFVGEIAPQAQPYEWRPQELEVAEVLEVPIEHLLDEENLIEVARQREGEMMIMEGFSYGDHVIWGATGRMLRNFFDVVFGDEADRDELAIEQSQANEA